MITTPPDIRPRCSCDIPQQSAAQNTNNPAPGSLPKSVLTHPLLALFLFLALMVFSTVLKAANPVYGNEIFLLARPPALEVYSTLGGLLTEGPQNAAANPLALRNKNGKDLFLSHSLWYDDLLSASSAAYTFILPQNRPLALSLQHISLHSVMDSRGALLDYGADGLPGTLDEGENNGRLDPGERLDLGSIQTRSLSSSALHVSTPLSAGSKHLGLTGRLLYQDLLAAKGYGLAFDLYYVRSFGPVQTLSKLADIPVAYTFFDNGRSEAYSPRLESAAMTECSLLGLILRPGLSLHLFPGVQLENSSDLGFAALQILPALDLSFRNLLSLGIAQHPDSGLKAAVQLSMQNFDLHYAWRGHQNDLGNSHLFALAFSLSNLLAE